MNGQTKSYKEKERIADDFIQRDNPYEKKASLKFDLRGYSEYLEKNHISGKYADDDIITMFSK